MAYSYSQWIDYLFARCHGTGQPFSGTFELTSRCNLDCRMCYIHKRSNDRAAIKEELSTEEWLSLAAQVQKKGTLLLLLTGGEPFLRSDFREIYTGCRKLGLLMSINTNGTLITEEMVEFLKKDAPLRVNVTLYGASPETYEQLCGNPDAYTRAYRAVKALMAAGIRVKLNYSATPYNVNDLPAVYRFARENNLLIQTASYMFPPVRACERCEAAADRLTPAESAAAAWGYECFRMEGNEELLVKRVQALLSGKEDPDSGKECQELPTEMIRCRAGDTTYWITYRGEMRPCGMMTVPSADVKALGFDEAWAKIREERKKILFPAKCTACTHRSACELCPAGCYAENGDFEKVPEYICQRTDAYLDLASRWLAGRTEKSNETE